MLPLPPNIIVEPIVMGQSGTKGAAPSTMHVTQHDDLRSIVDEVRKPPPAAAIVTSSVTERGRAQKESRPAAAGSRQGKRAPAVSDVAAVSSDRSRRGDECTRLEPPLDRAVRPPGDARNDAAVIPPRRHEPLRRVESLDTHPPVASGQHSTLPTSSGTLTPTNQPRRCYVCGEVPPEPEWLCRRCHRPLCRAHGSKEGFFNFTYRCHPCCRDVIATPPTTTKVTVPSSHAPSPLSTAEERQAWSATADPPREPHRSDDNPQQPRREIAAHHRSATSRFLSAVPLSRPPGDIVMESGQPSVPQIFFPEEAVNSSGRQVGRAALPAKTSPLQRLSTLPWFDDGADGGVERIEPAAFDEATRIEPGDTTAAAPADGIAAFPDRYDPQRGLYPS